MLVKNELKKLKTFDLSYFRGKSHFEEDGTQNYLVFQPIYKHFKVIAGVGSGSHIYYWKFKGLSGERINSIKTPSHSIIPNLDHYGTKTRVELDGGCLKQDKVTFNHEKVVNIYIAYEINKSANISKYSSDENYPTLQNALFGAISLTKNANIDKYNYSGYGIGFDRRSSFSFSVGGFGQNVITFGVDMSYQQRLTT